MTWKAMKVIDMRKEVLVLPEAFRSWLATKVDSQKVEAITSSGENVLLSAGAGCGKTTALSLRVLAQVLTCNISVSDMVILTFTDNAAREMRERIGEDLNDKAEADASTFPFVDRNVRARLKTEAQMAQTANITTFDSFANGILRKYASKAGIRSDFTILDETVESFVFQKEADAAIAFEFENGDGEIRKYFDKRKDLDGSKLRQDLLAVERFRSQFANPEKSFAYYLNHFSSPERIDKDYGIILDETLRKLTKINDGLKRFAELYGDKAKASSGAPLLASLQEKIKSIIKTSSERTTKGNFEALNDIRNMSLGMTLSYPRKVEKVPEGVVCPVATNWYKNFYGPKGENEQRDQRKGILVDSIKDVQVDLARLMPLGAYEDLLNSDRDDLAYLVGLDEKIHDKVQEFKSAHGAYTFSDIQSLMLSLFENDAEVREAERSRCLSLMVDEYQDSNDKQEELLRILGTSEKNWEDFCRSGDQTKLFDRDVLFMVGDVKQSIYRFRNAVPTLFMEKYDNPREYSCKVISMSSNYRSNSLVLGPVNDLFGTIMTSAIGGVDYRRPGQAIQVGPSHFAEINREDISPLSSLMIRSAEAEANGIYKTNQIKATEAELVAREIEKAVKANQGKTPLVDKKGHPKALGYSSFAILLRTRKDGDFFAKTLAAHHIPFVIDMNQDLTDADSVLLSQSLLRLMNLLIKYPELNRGLRKELSPDDKYWLKRSLASVARSFAVDEEDWQVVEDCRWVDGKNDKVPSLISQLDKFLSENQANSLPLSELFNRALDFFGVYVKIATTDEPQRERDALEWIQGLIANLSNLDFNLDDSVKLLAPISTSNTLNKNGIETKLMKGQGNYVTITTMHKSKGLEYDFVILPIVSSSKAGGGSPDWDLVCSRDFGFILKPTVADKKLLCAEVPEIQPSSFAADEKGWNYLTDKLPFDNPRLKAYGIAETQADGAETMRLLYVALTRAHFFNLLVVPEKVSTLSDDYVFGVKDPGDFASFLALGASFADFTIADLTGIDDRFLAQTIRPDAHKPLPKPSTGGPQVLLGMNLSQIPWPLATTDKRASKLSASIPDLEAEAFGTRLHKELELLDWSHFDDGYPDLSFVSSLEDRKIVSAFVDSPFIQGLKGKGAAFYKELGFIDPDSGREGSIDLAIALPDSAFVIDYKTKHLNDQAYQAQLGVYRKNLGRMLGMEPKNIRTFLYSLVDGVFKEVEPGIEGDDFPTGAVIVEPPQTQS